MSLRFIIIIALVAFAEYYSFIVVRSAVKGLPNAVKFSTIGVYLLLTAICWSGFIFFRQLNKPEFPHLLRNVFIAFAFGLLVGKLLTLAVMVIDDLRRLIVWLIALMAPQSDNGIKAAVNVSRSLFLKRAALVLAGISVGGFLLGMRNRYNYSIRRVAVKLPHLPNAFKGLKIVQLSDIHTGSFDSHEAVAVGIQKVLDLKPDIIFFTGDLVNNAASEVDEGFLEIFSKLKAPMGVYSILGNHDYGDYVAWPSPTEKAQNLDALKMVHHNAGWRLLLNEHIVLERGEEKIGLIGIENWGAKANFSRYGDLKAAWAGLETKNTAVNILLSHDPSHWDAQVRKAYPQIDLTLSGHTHGMQFGIDSKFFKWSPVQYIYKQWAGLYQEGAQHLYVNRGFGFIGYPGRIGIHPEITLLELV